MSAGDFVEVYSRSEYACAFDCVATCFFLDCAHNVIEFVEIIHRILKVCCIHHIRPFMPQACPLCCHSYIDSCISILKWFACWTAPCSAKEGVLDTVERPGYSLKGSNLQAGGLWINLGPLLYHWADAHTYLPGEELSIELSLEDVELIVKQQGFKTLQRCMVPAAFNTNIRCTFQPWLFPPGIN